MAHCHPVSSEIAEQKDTMKTWVGIKPVGIAGYFSKAEALKLGLLNPQKVDFGIHGLAWVQIDADGIVLKDKRKAPVHFCFPAGESVELVGLNDRESVHVGSVHRNAWLESFDRCVFERLEVQA